MGTTRGEVASFQTRRFIEDMRDSFCAGAVFSPAGYFLKGVYDNPKGKRLEGGLRAARMNAPQLTAHTTSIGGMFFTTYYTMKYVRQKEDLWNKITAGVATAGHVFSHQGLRLATRSAFLYGPVGGILVGYLNFMD